MKKTWTWMTSLRKSEKDLQDQIIEHLKSHDIYTLNVHGGGWGGRGTPDLLICFKGQFVAFELKVKGNTLEPAQRIHKKRIERNGGLHFAPYTFDEYLNIMKGLME